MRGKIVYTTGMLFFRKNKRPLVHRIKRSRPYLFVTSWLMRLLLQALYATLRVEFQGLAQLPKKSIVAFWHNQLLLAPLLATHFHKESFSVVISKSRDGKLLDSFVKTYLSMDVRIVEVGHQTRHAALLQIISELKENRIVMITPDGPRGPALSVKPGVCFSAKQADAPVIPMQWQASKIFQLPTWDKMWLPWPFAKVWITLKEPLSCPDGQTLQTALGSGQ